MEAATKVDVDAQDLEAVLHQIQQQIRKGQAVSQEFTVRPCKDLYQKLEAMLEEEAKQLGCQLILFDQGKYYFEPEPDHTYTIHAIPEEDEDLEDGYEDQSSLDTDDILWELEKLYPEIKDGDYSRKQWNTVVRALREAPC